MEEDPTYRQNVNIFKDENAQTTAVSTDEMEDPTYPRITLAEMLEDLHIEEENNENMEAEEE